MEICDLLGVYSEKYNRKEIFYCKENFIKKLYDKGDVMFDFQKKLCGCDKS